MKVVLRKPVPKIGQAGEIKEVSNGYARNFLIPKGLADLATKHSLGVITAQKRKIEKTNQAVIQDKQKLTTKLNRKKITISAKADEKGSLYAGIDKKFISQTLKSQGFNVEPQEIKLKEKIKKVGKKKVELKLIEDRVIITVDVKKL